MNTPHIRMICDIYIYIYIYKACMAKCLCKGMIVIYFLWFSYLKTHTVHVFLYVLFCTYLCDILHPTFNFD
jgi:hypothetical protein